MDVHPAAFADFRRQRIGRRDDVEAEVEGAKSPARDAVEVAGGLDSATGTCMSCATQGHR
jgi:hypothetical protein